jgi:hypothetical protein
VFNASVLWIARMGEPSCAQSFKTRNDPPRAARGKGEGQSRLLVPEMVMKDKWTFVALGYVLVLAALAFVLDGGIAAMVLFHS